MRLLTKSAALAATIAVALPITAWSGTAATAKPARPTRVLIVLFDQMVPAYADQFNMPR